MLGLVGAVVGDDLSQAAGVPHDVGRLAEEEGLAVAVRDGFVELVHAGHEVVGAEAVVKYSV